MPFPSMGNALLICQEKPCLLSTLYVLTKDTPVGVCQGFLVELTP